MSLSNGIRLPDLSEFMRVADCDCDHTLQNRDIMKTANTASGMDLSSRKPCPAVPNSIPRIENIVIVRQAETPNNFGQKGYLRFENVTMVRLL